MENVNDLEITTVIHSMPPMMHTADIETERKRRFDRKRSPYKRQRRMDRRRARAAKRAYLDGNI